MDQGQIRVVLTVGGVGMMRPSSCYGPFDEGRLASSLSLIVPA
jgi:hypothetical protein